MHYKFELLKLQNTSEINRNEYYAEVREEISCGFLWRKRKIVIHQIYGSSTVWHDYRTGNRVDPSPVCRFVMAQISLRKRPLL
ncbi:hypothetical protein P9VFCI_003 [Rhizobium phage P9VFCI]|uniref:Uncharacterized protein n=3 Tax=Innesvirus TaxID=3044739 RepID=A0A076YN88_9CAUD|nr:hypothetical protein P10VF_031 [Rhizobium phage vB_RleM_P10VF]YP_010661896.1 hypothetical protein PP937_gp003 [Rhizobium phage P9VFCI]YP_010662214.1 hypothetical protein PP938_gp064 [Rhizobium phage AF3]AIK68244.1 hypothetical protein P10VF_031 [Rhizobium phage vB_RleM_P10VF]QNH71554.1 hypothetical protein AF3_064 [Rhizobium phage AF3]QNH71973.1 hypothetical protein P9VFCI_003 [Rhizobium phage P9VFCI]